MPNIALNLKDPKEGQLISFTTPCDCNEVTDGLVIDGEVYSIVDALGHVVTGVNSAWKAGAKVSFILDVFNKKAYIQNPNTNTYLEGKLNEKLPKSGGALTGALVFDKIVFKRGVNYGTKDEMDALTDMTIGQAFFVLSE